jgi:hypothetical protein
MIANINILDFILGISFLLLLLPLNNVIISIKNYRPQWGLAVPYVSFFANLLTVLTYGIIVRPYTLDNKLFVSGLLLALFFSMLYKITKLIKE